MGNTESKKTDGRSRGPGTWCLVAFVLSGCAVGERRLAGAAEAEVAEPTTQPAVGDLTVNGTPLTGRAEHGMEVISVLGDRDAVQVTTTGAVYELGRREMTLIRRIDPATNEVCRDTSGRRVAKMVFDADLGPLVMESASKRVCIVASDCARFDFHSDGLTLITSQNAETLKRKNAKTLRYRYESLIEEAPWVKGQGGERMWTDGYGGSLHAAIPGGRAPIVTDIAETGMTVSLEPGAGAAVAVFPPKRFDFEKLYGAGARPHLFWAGNTDRELEATASRLDELRGQRFGVIILYAGHYDGVHSGETRDDEEPVQDGGRWVYRFRDPDRVKTFVELAHSKGFKVICYLAGGRFAKRQPPEATLEFMRQFRAAHALDGWYFDHAGAGRNWLESYDFVRQVRADVGAAGVLLHHDSVDVWGGWDGRRLVPLDAYMDYTLSGETGPLADDVQGPKSAYLRYCVSGYGLSQALGIHKIATSGRAAITLEESLRVAAENLLGGSRCAAWSHDEWMRAYRPGYEARRAAYLAGHLKPEVDWPADWFGDVTGLQVGPCDSGSVEITWQTPVVADSEVRCAKLQGGGLSGAGDTSIRKHDPMKGRTHRIVLRSLEPGTEYQFAVRSRARRGDGGEHVWGGAGRFTAP